MKVYHVSAEYYPAAKVGGLADVVGSLPAYQSNLGVDTSVIIPKYGTPWFESQAYETVWASTFWYPDETVSFSIQRVLDEARTEALYVIDIPGKFDRAGVYSDESGYYSDGAERWLSFQRAVLDWILHSESRPDVIHVHDYHAGLIPFMMQYSYDYGPLKSIDTVYTIHNQQYHGAFGWDRQYLLPAFDTWKSGLLDWSHMINPMAAGVKCAHRVTTVSPSYLRELKYDASGLEWLFEHYEEKCVGILNGIDPLVWDPKADHYIDFHLKKSVANFKKENKKKLASHYHINPKRPIVSFIGRMVDQKGADLLAEAMTQMLSEEQPMSFVILGTGDAQLEDQFRTLQGQYPNSTGITLAYNEGLAHRIYASSDFLIMPSRREPCGLNQMYAMRYGTIPIVHHTGGLIDSVVPYDEDQGTGIKFDELNTAAVISALHTAISLYQNKESLANTINHCMEADFTWGASSKKYIELYEGIK